MKAQDLKNSILQLAVQGKLVSQDPSDEPASKLLERIRGERAKLIEQKKIRKPKGGESVIYREEGSWYERRGKSDSVCIDDEIPFDIPESWEWARLGSLLSVVSDGTHKTPVYRDSGVPFLSVQNISKGYFDLNNVKYVDQETHESLCKRVKPMKGDILLCRIGTLGKPLIVDVDFEFSIFVSLGLLRPIDTSLSPWIMQCIDSPHGFNWIQEVKVGGGTHTFKINLGDIPSFPVPVPPLEEQKRIVERVDELMPLVEEYGRLEDAREKLDAELPDRLRKSVLPLAVEGKLVPQDPSDEPASELLERIRGERGELVKQKKIRNPKGGESVIYREGGSWYERRGKSEPVCIDDELPFDIPESWEWARLGAIVFQRPQVKPDRLFNYIDIGSIDNTCQNLGPDENLIEPAKAPSRARKPVQAGDILYSTVRPYLHNMCIVDREFSAPPIASTGFAAMVCHKGVCNEYLFNYLRSPGFDAYANANENSKGVAYPAINDRRLYEALVPIPPLEEQRRIVEKVNRIMKLIGA